MMAGVPAMRIGLKGLPDRRYIAPNKKQLKLKDLKIQSTFTEITKFRIPFAVFYDFYINRIHFG